MGRRTKLRKTNPLILIKYEGGKAAENIYFSNFSERNCRIKFASGNSTDFESMFEELKKYMINNDILTEDGNKIFLVIDTDLDERKIKMIQKIEPDCKKLGIEIITSAPTFEIWYLLHFRNKNLKFKNSKDVKKAVEDLIPGYKETMNVYEKIGDNTEVAIENAKKIEKQFKIDDKYNFDPHSYVYKIIDSIEEIKKNNSNYE